MNEEAKNMDKNLNQSMQHVPQYQEDEINLLDLWRVVVRQKIWIIIITIVFTSGACIYALSVTPLYTTGTVLLPPISRDIEMLTKLIPQKIDTMDTPIVDKINENQVFEEFVLNLKNSSLQQEYFNQNKLDDVVVRVSGKNPLTVIIEGKSGNQLAEGLNGFVSYVDEYTSKNIADSFSIKLKNTISDLQQRIDFLRLRAKQMRLDMIAALTEQLEIAERMDIIEPQVDVANLPTYFRGTRALQAEIDIYQARKENDYRPHHIEILLYQADLTKLNKAKIDYSKVHSARVAKIAEQPLKPIKPKINRIVLLWAIIGFTFGIFFAFVKNYIEQQMQDA